jgi:hypothetical protein
MLGLATAYFGINGGDNIAMGACAMYGNNVVITGSYNVALGRSSLRNIQDGTYNIAIGSNSLGTNTDGNFNTAVGVEALCSNITGNHNTAIGVGAMATNNIGSCNVAVGSCSLKYNTYGLSNTAIGIYALAFNVSGCNNIAVGYCSAYNFVGGDNNVSVGCTGGFNYGFNNILLGRNLGKYDAIGCSNFVAGTNAHNGAGCYNITIGDSGLTSTSGSNNNIAFGYSSLRTTTTGNCNIGMGPLSAYSNTTGFDNIAIGSTSLLANTYGNNNIALGTNALRLNTIGCNNTAIGSFAGCTNAGSNNTFIGYNAQGQSASCNNTITLGNTSIACIRGQVAMTTFSDCRDKTNICSIPVGLDFVRALRPVKFEWNMRDNPTDGKKGMTEPGFLAQELAEVVDKFDAGWMNVVHKDNPDRLEATVSRLLPVAIKAIQELSIEVDRLRNLIEPPISN